MRERPSQLYLFVEDLETVVSCNRPLNPATNPPQCVAFATILIQMGLDEVVGDC